MCPVTNSDTQDIGAEPLHAVKVAGDVLAGYLKTGPLSESHAAETRAQVAKLIASIPPTVDKATEGYRSACERMLADISLVRGLPTRQVIGDGGSDSKHVSSSGDHTANNFDSMLPAIMERLEACVARYASEANSYLSETLDRFDASVCKILEQVPVGGSKDKAIRIQITELKKEMRTLARWDKWFYSLNASSFTAEVDFLFALQGGPIAAIWHYSDLDEQTDLPKAYDHKPRADLVYAIRGSWALTKGLMTPGPAGYLDEISRPGQETGCMCRLRFVHSMGNIPHYMVTDFGLSERRRVKNIIDLQMTEASISSQPAKKADAEAAAAPAKAESTPPGLAGKILRWLRRA